MPDLLLYRLGNEGTALPRGAKRIDNLRFSILLGLQLSLWGYLGATERKRSYLEVGPKKENGSTVTGS